VLIQEFGTIQSGADHCVLYMFFQSLHLLICLYW